MANPANLVSVTGRLAAAPRIFPNKDKSRSAKLTVYAQDNFATNGEYRSTAIDFSRFIPAANETNGIYDSLVAGQLVTIAGHIEVYVANEKRLERVMVDGVATILEKEVKVYKTQLVIDNIAPLESPEAVKARKEARAASATQDEAPAAEAQTDTQSEAPTEAAQETVPAPHEASDNPPF